MAAPAFSRPDRDPQRDPARAGLGPIVVAVRRLGTSAAPEVRDYGPGISHAELNQVYSRFAQVGQSGPGGDAGLGLCRYIASEIVTEHGGTIAVDSTLGDSTRFVVRLPLPRDRASKARPAVWQLSTGVAGRPVGSAILWEPHGSHRTAIGV
jgi:signal transduction histidine kinase